MNAKTAPAKTAPAKTAPAQERVETGRDDPPIAIVAAIAANGVLGHNNKTPWHLPSDLQHFRELTLGKPLLMGRKTYESIGRPLPGRRTIVLSRKPDLVLPAEVLVARNIESALALAKVAARELQADEIILTGGAELFALMIDRAARLYLTFVDLSPAGDIFFPSIDWSCWKEKRREAHLPQKGDEATFTFIDFERRLPNVSDISFPHE